MVQGSSLALGGRVRDEGNQAGWSLGSLVAQHRAYRSRRHHFRPSSSLLAPHPSPIAPHPSPLTPLPPTPSSTAPTGAESTTASTIPGKVRATPVSLEGLVREFIDYTTSMITD